MEKITVLEFLCLRFGWQGGTIHQALQELEDRCNSELGYYNKLALGVMWRTYLHENLIDIKTAGFKEVENILK